MRRLGVRPASHDRSSCDVQNSPNVAALADRPSPLVLVLCAAGNSAASYALLSWAIPYIPGQTCLSRGWPTGRSTLPSRRVDCVYGEVYSSLSNSVRHRNTAQVTISTTLSNEMEKSERSMRDSDEWVASRCAKPHPESLWLAIAPATPAVTCILISRHLALDASWAHRCPLLGSHNPRFTNSPSACIVHCALYFRFLVLLSPLLQFQAESASGLLSADRTSQLH